MGQKTARLATLRPAAENAMIYGDGDIDDLVSSIRKEGVLQPLVVTRDAWIISGHRRWRAAHRAHLKAVPVDVQDFRRADDEDRFIRLIREHNRYRDKTFSETLREQIVERQDEDPVLNLLQHRVEQADVSDEIAEHGGVIHGEDIRLRSAVISPERQPLADAALALAERLEGYWPLGKRRYFYGLLDVVGLMRNTKLGLPFSSDRDSYRAVCNVMNDLMRLDLLDRGAVGDETRPVTLAQCWSSLREFLNYEIDVMLVGYEHDLLVSQPNHIEIVGEKLTIGGVIRPVAARYTMPFTIGRGFCSPPVLRDIAQRYLDSHRSKLILLVISDCDPEGMFIPGAVGKTLLEHSEDLIAPDDLLIVRVALTMTQVGRLKLRPSYDAESKNSSRKAAYKRRYGTTNAYELEAAEPEDIASILDESIRTFLDLDAFNAEVTAHNKNAAEINDLKAGIVPLLRDHLLPEAEDK